MANIQIYKKPKLILLEENKKLRDYSDEQRNMQCINLVNNLLSDLGVGKNADTKHHLRAIKFLNDSCVNYTPQEIEKAFQLAIEGVLNVNLLQQINPLVIGLVMREYHSYKVRETKEYRRKLVEANFDSITEVSQSQKIEWNKYSVRQSLSFFLENHFVDTERIYVYDILFAQGYLPKDAEYKNKIYTDALYIVEQDLRNEKAQSRERKSEIKLALKNLNLPKQSPVILKSKELVLAEFYRNLRKDAKKLEEFELKFK